MPVRTSGWKSQPQALDPSGRPRRGQFGYTSFEVGAKEAREAHASEAYADGN